MTSSEPIVQEPQDGTGTISVLVTGQGDRRIPIHGALVCITPEKRQPGRSNSQPPREARTGRDGVCTFHQLPFGNYKVTCESFSSLSHKSVAVVLETPKHTLEINDPINVSIGFKNQSGECCEHGATGKTLRVCGEVGGVDRCVELEWTVQDRAQLAPADDLGAEVFFTPYEPGRQKIGLAVRAELPVAAVTVSLLK